MSAHTLCKLARVKQSLALGIWNFSRRT